MNKGGRPRDPIWEHFAELECDGKVEAMRKKCGRKQSVKVNRMKDHFKRCSRSESSDSKADDPVGLLPLQAETSMHQVQQQSETVKCESADGGELEAKKRKLQVGIGQFVCKTSSETKTQLDLAISRLFYGCNIPFAFAEHELFKNMITALRPGYQPPPRKALADNLLDNVSNELQIEMQKELQGKDVTLVEDGWSNVHNDPVTATCVHVNGKSFFVKATDNGSAKKTAEYCKDQCSATMAEIEQKYACKVRSIVTDNEKKLEKMKTLLQQDDDQLIVYGCSSHWLNLLGQELTTPQIMKHVVEVQKYFRNHHQPSGWLKEVSEAVKPQIPGDTRWNSQLTCTDTFIKNHAAYAHVVNSHASDSCLMLDYMCAL